MRRMLPARHRGERTRGQSLVEFALVLPLMLLLLMVAVDFSRAYLGWINLHNAAREAANYAALNPRGWTGATGVVAIQDRYASLITDETTAINCGVVAPVAPPTFPSGDTLGGDAIVTINCQFRPITPLITEIIGTNLTLTARADFPIRTGAIASLPTSGGGGGGNPIPVANFSADQLSGVAPLTVTFTDLSSNAPSAWSWTFGNGATRTGTTLAEQNPTYTYDTPGSYTVTLTASNVNGSDVETKDAYITVGAAPAGPMANFTFAPDGGTAPLDVTFTDTSTGSPTSWAWTFGDGGTFNDQAPPIHTYATSGTYSITLKVTNEFGTNPVTKTITVDAPICTVPNFAGVLTSAATSLWTSRGFAAGNISFKDPVHNGPLDYVINFQSITGGHVPAQGCNAHILVGP